MNMRDLKEMMLVTANGRVGFVASWNRNTVFVHVWDPTEGTFEEQASACARDRVEPGGIASWDGKLPKRGGVGPGSPGVGIGA